jgi:o-succinylbenzoate---CoA ligase
VIAPRGLVGADLPPDGRVGLVTGPPGRTAAVLEALRGGPLSVVLVDGRLPGHEQTRRLTACGVAAVIAPGGMAQPAPGRTRDEQPSVLVFTSGTTAAARAVVLPWRALERSAAAVAQAVDLRPEDRWVCPLPLSHVAGLGVLLRCWQVGATPHLLDRPDPVVLASALAGGSHASLVARSLARLLDEVPHRPLSRSLRLVMVGGGRTDPALITRARAAGIPAVTTYGMTEAGSTVTLHRPDVPSGAAGDAGWPLPHVDVTVDDSGRLLLSGDALCSGYDGEPPLRPPFDTGDFGRLEPDGRLVVLDRRTDRIVTGGENISPSEIEAVLDACPAVAESCVVGLPDPDWGQRLVAAVRWAGPEASDALRAWTAERLSPWQRPKELVARSEPLPRTALGKLVRAEVRASLTP